MFQPAESENEIQTGIGRLFSSGKSWPDADCYADLQVLKHNGLGSLARSRVFCRNCIA
jgi:hypothetical protein